MSEIGSSSANERLPKPVRQLTPKIVADAIRKNGGILAAAAQQLGTSRQNIWNFCERYDECREAQRDAKNMTLDLAEGNLLKQIQNSNMTAIIFYLKCHGKDRGYVERHEITGPGGGPIHTLDLSRLDLDELRALEAALSRAAIGSDRQGPLGEEAGGVPASRMEDGGDVDLQA
jgi:hypothetical protein